MDFLKALLVYLSLTTAVSLQAAPTPERTPVPTPAPTAIVTPAPVETPNAAAKPTITPNNRYHLLRLGSKGTEVKRLQQRLQELGYLKGSIDGSYGGQTQSAVVAFQRANGLSHDGVAGPATQTILFESPDVVANPATRTATPKPTATPDVNGMIPLPEDPMSQWINRYGATVLLNGTAVQKEDGTRPRVWQKNTDYLLSVNDMASMTEDWQFTAEGVNSCSLSIAGHQFVIRMREAIAASRGSGDTSYCEMYNVWMDNQPVIANQGDVGAERNQWYLSVVVLERALNAEVKYDSDENALIIRYSQNGAGGSND